MSHIPYYGEDEKNIDNKKDARDVKKPCRWGPDKFLSDRIS